MFRSRSIGRGGVTLVEMMIAMIITLMIVFAMVEAFRRIGETTTDGRAVIEMLGQMRQARRIVEEDISRCTIPPAMRDPRNLLPDQYHGYFEVIEGTGNDTTPGRYMVRTPAGLLYNTFDFSGVAGESQTLFGDLDDYLCMTMRNDDVPFRGRMAYPGPDNTWGTGDDFTTIIESNLAEVIWWAELNDQPQDVDGDGVINPPVDNVPPGGDGFIDVPGEGGYGVWDPGETFTIRRRVLLIRPDLTIPDPSMNAQVFLRDSDLSVHHDYDATTQAYLGLKANSLGDLTFRWNRVAHIPINGLPNSAPPANGNARGLTQLLHLSPIDPTQMPAYSSASLRGEDVVLSSVTAFDLRVWDPNAPVCGYLTLNGELPEGLVPGDPGYAGGTTPIGGAAYVTAVNGSTEGFGAFVDLGAVDLMRNGVDDDGQNGADDPREAILNPLGAQFLSGMAIRSYLPFGNYVYDPWTLAYESDGYNQDGDALTDEGTDNVDQNSLNGPDELITNYGNNGIDDDGVGGIDDPGELLLPELETAPPYPHPLKVLQLRIRMYEPDTRQVKQVSQNIEFAK